MQEEPDEVEFLIAFEKQFLSAPTTHIADWVSRWPIESERDVIAVSLVMVAFEHTLFDFTWLQDLHSTGLLPESVWRSKELFQHAYRGQVSKGQQPCWNDYAQWEFTAVELELRCPGDRCYLGEILFQRFTLLQRLGSGGLGTVYEACDVTSGDVFAVKIPRHTDAPERVNERLSSEGRVLESLSGAGIPGFIEILDTHAGPVLVMDRIQGVELQSKIPHHGLAYQESLKIAARIACVIDRLHQCGFVHGDIKAANILVGEAGDINLIDFNVSRQDDPSSAAEGFPGGTLPFMSPEAIVGVAADVDLKQDIYALGTLLFQLCQGSLMMTAEEREDAVVKAVLLGGKHDPHFHDDTPEPIRDICRNAISRHAAERFETAAEFGEACDLARRAIARSTDFSLPLSPDIKCWRLGAAMGTIAVRQRRITTELVSHGWPGSEAESRDALLELLPYAVGVATAREEVVCLSKLLKLHIDDWTGDEIYLRLLYRQRRLSLEDYEQFAAAAPIAEQWCRATLDSFRTQLIESHPNSAGLFLAATQSRLAAYSLKAAHQWPAVTEALAVPESVIGPFSSACRSFATVNDWGPVLQSLDYRMVRWLRWNLEP